MNAHPRLRLLAPLLLVASCNSGAKLAAAKFAGPSALAVFRGYSVKHPGEAAPRPYLAVANLLRDEITLVDPLDNEPILSATLSFPLSVPTRPRPFKLATAMLETSGERGPDLLVVATQSPPSLQLVTTWTEEVKAVDLAVEDDLARLYPGSVVLSLAAATRPGGGAWVFVGLTGGHLAVLEFERDAGSTLPLARRPVRRSALPLQQKDLLTGAGRFDPLDLALLPDGSRLFVATSDPLHTGGGATVSGVGQLALTASAADAWPAVGLDARGPTRLVTAGSLAQRTVASSVVFESIPSPQVFAVLDEEGCGLRRAISCGLVTLLPDAGIAPDPAGELTHRAPIPLGGSATALALVMPRQGGDPGTPVGVSWDTSPAPAIDLLTITGSAARTGEPIRFWQTALLVVAMADGRLLAVDPGRWGVVNAEQRRDAARRLLVTSVLSAVTSPRLGVWNDVSKTQVSPLPADAVITDNAAMHQEVRSTAGYLPDGEFTVAWQGALPGMASVSGALRWDGAQAIIADLQTAAGSRVQVDDPELGARAGDRVLVVPTAAACRLTGSPATEKGFTATVTAVLPASTSFPGGALALSHAGAGNPGNAADTACDTLDLVGATSPGPVAAATTVSVPGLVISHASLGYLGRPELDADFELRYQPEAGLTGEALAVARKLRRRFYSSDAPCGAAIPGTETGTPPQPLTYGCDATLVTPPGADPLTPGPALKLRIGCEGGAPGCVPGTGAALLLTATSGSTNAIWLSPATLGVPTAVVWLDASTIDASTSSRTSTVYASFTTNEVVSLVPNTAAITSIR